jgi:hypothetical protein
LTGAGVLSRHTVTSVYNQQLAKAQPVTCDGTNRHKRHHKPETAHVWGYFMRQNQRNETTDRMARITRIGDGSGQRAPLFIRVLLKAASLAAYCVAGVLDRQSMEDVIWMAPCCPQWFAAIGETPARYFYYKDINRAPLGEAEANLVMEGSSSTQILYGWLGQFQALWRHGFTQQCGNS